MRVKVGDFLSQDDFVLELIPGAGITITPDELEHRPIRLQIDAGGGAAGAATEIATFARAGTIAATAGTGRFMMPRAGAIVGVSAAINTAPTGAAVIVDLNRNGATLFSTQANRPTVGIGQFATVTAAVPDITTFSAGDFLTVDVDQVGATVAGADLVVQVAYTLS